MVSLPTEYTWQHKQTTWLNIVPYCITRKQIALDQYMHRHKRQQHAVLNKISRRDSLPCGRFYLYKYSNFTSYSYGPAATSALPASLPVTSRSSSGSVLTKFNTIPVCCHDIQIYAPHVLLSCLLTITRHLTVFRQRQGDCTLPLHAPQDAILYQTNTVRINVLAQHCSYQTLE